MEGAVKLSSCPTSFGEADEGRGIEVDEVDENGRYGADEVEEYRVSSGVFIPFSECLRADLRGLLRVLCIASSVDGTDGADVSAVFAATSVDGALSVSISASSLIVIDEVECVSPCCSGVLSVMRSAPSVPLSLETDTDEVDAAVDRPEG